MMGYRPGEAEAHARASLATRERLTGSMSLPAAASLAALAAALLAGGQSLQAAALAHRCLAIRHAGMPERWPGSVQLVDGRTCVSHRACFPRLRPRTSRSVAGRCRLLHKAQAHVLNHRFDSCLCQNGADSQEEGLSRCLIIRQASVPTANSPNSLLRGKPGFHTWRVWHTHRWCRAAG